MSKHLFKLLFGALFLVAATAFTGCSDDDDKKSGNPELTASPETLTFSDETELTQTVTISANCEWKVVKSNLDWATVEPMSGKGSGKITVTVSEIPAGTTMREGTISFSLIHPEWGPWDTAESKVAVKQVAGGDIPSGDPIYSNNFDKEPATQDSNKKWPYADAFEGWKNQTGTGAAGVTYAVTSMSVRANSESNNNYSKYKDAASGVNNMFFASGASMEIQKIALAPAQKNLRMTFGTYKSLYGATDNQFVTSEFHVYLSQDGAAWTEITYDRPVADDEKGSSYGTWALATADFTLATVPAELYVKFASDLASAHRIDDVKLVEGAGGQNVEFGEAPDPTTTSIGNIKTAGTYITEGTVVARGKMAYIIADNTGAMMVYHKDNERTVGEKIKIEGAVTIYNATSTPQFSEAATVTVISSGNAWTYNPAPMDAAAMDALVTASPVCKEVQFEGVMAISGNNVNVTIDGAATAIGSVKYIDNTTIASLDGKKVVVKGYFVGVSASKYVNVLPYSVEETGSTPSTDPKISAVNPTSLSFAAAGEDKDVNVTLNSAAAGLAIEAAADNNQFGVAVSGTKVTVTAKENATESKIEGTLTIKLMKDGAAVDTKTVTLSQAAKSSEPSGDEKTVTMSFADIKAGGSEMPVNSYGSQDVATSSTWYNWTFDGLNFAGAKICEANATDYVGTLQMQGNASDAKKQGFFGNVDDLGKITKIVVVSKNTKYAPTEHLYMGTEANPAGNAQTSTVEQDGQIYTETFEIDGDYGFFKLHNDKQGAFYVQSISITYKK